MSENTITLFNSVFKTQNQQVHLNVLKEKNIQLYIKREDKIHPLISGNKFRKLKYNLKEAKKLKKKILLTFGGAFSNHILATAVAGNLKGFKTIGVIRGEELGKNLQKTLSENTTLKEAHKIGMKLHFITREHYRQKKTYGFIEKLKNKWGDFYLIPEGGTNCLAVKGCEEILTKDDAFFNYCCCSVGTGGTLAGLINSANKEQKIIGFPSLKGNFLSDEIKKYTLWNNNWSLHNAYHFGGYGKYNDELIRFMNTFKKQTTIPLDPIYTGKLLYGILDLVKNDYFKAQSKILAIHTGGLQGIEGVNNQLRKKNKKLSYNNVSSICFNLLK